MKKGRLNLRNAYVMAPMTTWSSDDDYSVSEQELAYYAARSKEVGMVITGCAHISENGIGFTNEIGVYDDRFIPRLAQLAEKIKAGGAVAVLQINHAGNKALPSLTDDIMSASPVTTEATAFAPSLTPREMSESDIQRTIVEYGQAAHRAIMAGFDGIELHGAHGFLLQNFLSPHFNQRKDQWGGTLDNRLRFPLAVVAEVQRVIAKEATRPFILGYRVSPDEPLATGLKVEETLELAERLVEQGVDYLHLSLAGASQSRPKGSDKTYTRLFSDVIAGRVSLMVAGGIVNERTVQDVKAEGADLMAIGHGLITDLNWVSKIERGEEPHQTLSPKRIAELQLPDKLWHQLKASGNWFVIEDSDE
ncbi:2,4-dienoyl-CoA reductase-like NADH-dependent reductase (Old Yellow Enzyme family) [Streptococcus rupicaprae]|uniref:2,4-dienoyl-CoA reductase-like NADH-dependent reductase (Old Yellow Enzyme family) n=1 Tax=Streptococcus rupicaprae TaxID=759619 RepID=A0ABV2FL01_9STRE